MGGLALVEHLHLGRLAGARRSSGLDTAKGSACPCRQYLIQGRLPPGAAPGSR